MSRLFAGMHCPKCQAIIPESAAVVDTVGICPICDALFELERGVLRVIADEVIDKFDEDLHRTLGRQPPKPRSDSH